MQIAGWVGFFCVTLMATTTFISFSLSPFLCNLLVSTPGYVSCLVYLKISGVVLFVSFSPPCQSWVSSVSLARAFCLLPAQTRTKLAAHSWDLFKCGVLPPLDPSLQSHSLSPSLRTTVLSKILLSGLLCPSHSFVSP